jgi:hypothetical protein
MGCGEGGGGSVSRSETYPTSYVLGSGKGKPVTIRKSPTRQVAMELWRFVLSRPPGNAAPPRCRPRWRPCFAPIVLPQAHCISPRRSGPLNRKPGAGSPTVHRQKRRTTRRDKPQTQISSVSPFGESPALHPGERVTLQAPSFPVLETGTHTYLGCTALDPFPALRFNAALRPMPWTSDDAAVSCPERTPRPASALRSAAFGKAATVPASQWLLRETGWPSILLRWIGFAMKIGR